MEQVYKELEEMRSAMEALTEECRAKSLLNESLRRAHDAQVARLQEAKSEFAKQAKEIDAKDEELCVAKQMYEDLRSSFSEKESAMKHLSLANDNLKASFNGKLARLEGENKELVLSLDKASKTVEEQELTICSYKEEIEGLKDVLSLVRKKCSDAEQRAKAAKEGCRRDEMLLKLEQQKDNVEEQLKWKSEQFRHIEEAHDKLLHEFRTGRKEWELERSSLVDEISSLQANLDSQIRVADELHSQLQMCNHALACEESQRKSLEIQMSEFKALHENVVSKFEEARLKIESMVTRRDEEVATLRNSLAATATHVKELEFRSVHLEQENQELLSSLKELQEAQINGVDAASSVKNLRQKLRVLEQAHRDCTEKLKARDVKWCAETEKLSKKLDECLSKLSSSNKHVQELQNELEGSHSTLMQQKLENEELRVVLMILKSKCLESFMNLEDFKHEMEQHSGKAEERIALLMEQLERKNSALAEALAETNRQCGMIDSLRARVEYLEHFEQENMLMKKDLFSYKAMIDESSRNLDRLKEAFAQNESDLQKDLGKALDAVDQANCVIAKKTGELRRVEFELQQLRSVVECLEKLKYYLETELTKYRNENLSIRRDFEELLLAKLEAEKALVEGKSSFVQAVEEKDKRIKELEHQVVTLGEDKRELVATTSAKFQHGKSSGKENEEVLQFIEDERMRLEGIQTDLLGQNYFQKEIEFLVNNEAEKERFLQVVEEKENTIAAIQQQILLCKEDNTRLVKATAAFNFEIKTLNKAAKKTIEAHIFGEHEIQYKNILVAELEEEISALKLELEDKENLLFCLKNSMQVLKTKSAMELLEKEAENVRIQNELHSALRNKKTLEDRMENFNAHKKDLHKIIGQLSSEREELMGKLMEFGNLMEQVSDNGEKMMQNWDRIVQHATDDEATVTNSEGEDLYRVVQCITCEDATIANVEGKILFSSNKVDGRHSKNKTGLVLFDRRLPLKEQVLNVGRTGETN